MAERTRGTLRSKAIAFVAMTHDGRISLSGQMRSPCLEELFQAIARRHPGARRPPCLRAAANGGLDDAGPAPPIADAPHHWDPARKHSPRQTMAECAALFCPTRLRGITRRRGKSPPA